MKSALADRARRDLQAQVSRLTAEQRLAAFLEHCQLISQLRATKDPVRVRRSNATAPADAH